MPRMRNERFANHTMVASPTMILFLFQMAMLVGPTNERLLWKMTEWRERRKRTCGVLSIVKIRQRHCIKRSEKVSDQMFLWTAEGHGKNNLLTKLKVTQTLESQ